MTALLRDADVIVVDCQATGASPAHGAPMELGWMRTRAAEGVSGQPVVTRLLRLPPGTTISRAVTRVTGLRTDDLRAGVDPLDAWHELATLAGELARGAEEPRARAVIHFARFEHAFLRSLHAAAADSTDFPFELVCTHEIARRLLPDLPRRGLRALTGYFGQAVGPLRRSAQHVTATAFVWTQIVEALAAEDVRSFADLTGWLEATTGPVPRRRVYPMPRALRLSLPEQPGVYRMLRVGGDVLYVGKATVLRSRVNSHFRKQSGVHERALEMLAQARDLSWTTTETAVEAALLETDEIKRLRPPYNVALLEEGRSLWYATSDLRDRARAPDARHVLGPFGSRELVESFALLADVLDQVDPPLEARARGLLVGVPAPWAPSPEQLAAGLARLRATQATLREGRGSARSRLLALGTAQFESFRAAAEPDEAEEPSREREWDEAAVERALVVLAVRAAQGVRRATWIARLAESTVTFREPALSPAGTVRVLTIARGRIAERTTSTQGAEPPVPPGFARPRGERCAALTVADYDRLRVLTTELRRTVGAGDPAASIRFGPRVALRGEALARVLSWV